MINSLFISYDGATDSIGQSQIIPYLNGLSKNGISFTLLTFEKKECLIDKEKISLIKSELKKNGIRWIYLKYHKKPTIISTFFDIINGIFVSIWLVHKYKIDCIHARSYVAAFIGVILKRLFRLKFVFDMRGFWADERVEGRIWKTKGTIYKITKFLEKRFFLNSNEIVILTYKAKEIIDMLEYKVKANINVIPCMVDTDRFRFNMKDRQNIRNKYGFSSRFVFLYSGSLEYWYMKDKMLDFFLVAREVVENCYFLILSTMDKKYIKSIVTSKGINGSDFLILERVPYEDMPKFISASDTGIFFITPVFSKKASSPTKFAEYMSCGLPVITNSGIGDLDEIVLNYKVGTIVNDFSRKEYENKIEEHMKLIKNGDTKERCVKLANDMFALYRGVDCYTKIYKRLERN
ncbi:MAG: glycosyltransferase family 4 protein [Candidatus Omnitrophica bacterium]|nr:glycosyltransferase family 4 protein [Candidatus Omnitrophota bacterium]